MTTKDICQILWDRLFYRLALGLKKLFWSSQALLVPQKWPLAVAEKIGDPKICSLMFLVKPRLTQGDNTGDADGTHNIDDTDNMNDTDDTNNTDKTNGTDNTNATDSTDDTNKTYNISYTNTVNSDNTDDTNNMTTPMTLTTMTTMTALMTPTTLYLNPFLQYIAHVSVALPHRWSCLDFTMIPLIYLPHDKYSRRSM